MKKVALFGGSFDPPTLAHQYVVDLTLMNCPIDEVWMMPCYKSLYGKNLQADNHRLNMLSLQVNLFKQSDKVKVSAWEVSNKVVGKTFDIIERLVDEWKDEYEFWFVIGGDNVDKVISHWYRGKELTQKHNFIIIPRKGYTPQTDWWKKENNFIAGTPENASDISSTSVREQIRNGATEIKELAKPVYDYIIQHNLYKGE